MLCSSRLLEFWNGKQLSKDEERKSWGSFKPNVRREALLIFLFPIKAACSKQRRQSCLLAQLQNISAPSKTTFSEESRVTAGSRFMPGLLTKILWNTGQHSLLNRCFGAYNVKFIKSRVCVRRYVRHLKIHSIENNLQV